MSKTSIWHEYYDLALQKMSNENLDEQTKKEKAQKYADQKVKDLAKTKPEKMTYINF
jgi:hypothetical protein